MGILLSKAFYTLDELNDLGYSYYQVRKMIHEGQLARLNKRYIENVNYDGIVDDFNYIPYVIDQGVICMLSASVYYGYTTYRPHVVDVAVHSNRNIYAMPEYPAIQLHYFNNKRLKMEVEEVKNDVGSFYIYSREKTVCDFLLSKTKVDSEEIKNVLVGYLNDEKRDINKLSMLAKELGCIKLLQTYLEVLL